MSCHHALQVLADFTCGRSHILATLSVKLKHWEVLPWSLAILGGVGSVLSEGAAQEAVKQMLQKFDQDTLYGACDQEHLHHHLTWQYFKSDLRMREELNQFSSGTPLPSLPLLARLGAKWRFTPTVLLLAILKIC